MDKEKMDGAGTRECNHPADQSMQCNFTTTEKQLPLFDGMSAQAPKAPPRGTLLWAALCALANGAIHTGQFASWRLAAYCWTLRMEYGWPVESVLISAPTGVANGRAKIARYFLDAEHQQMAQTVVGGVR